MIHPSDFSKLNPLDQQMITQMTPILNQHGREFYLIIDEDSVVHLCIGLLVDTTVHQLLNRNTLRMPVLPFEEHYVEY